MGLLPWNSIIEALFFFSMSMCIASALSALLVFAGSIWPLSGSLGAGMHCTLLRDGMPSTTHSPSFPVLSHIGYFDAFAFMGRKYHLLLCSNIPLHQETLCIILYYFLSWQIGFFLLETKISACSPANCSLTLLLFQFPPPFHGSLVCFRSSSSRWVAINGHCVILGENFRLAGCVSLS